MAYGERTGMSAQAGMLWSPRAMYEAARTRKIHGTRA